MSETFSAQLLRGDTKNTMGLVIPAAVVERLGQGKRPAVRVRLQGYEYASTVASMGGQFLIGIAAEHRAALHLEGLDSVEVTLVVDDGPRDTPVPADLQAALAAAGAEAAFRALAPSRRKEAVRQVEEAKSADTRARRILKVVDSVSGPAGGRPEP